MSKFFLAAWFHCCLITALTAQRPNIVLIHTDDHRFTGIHALGGQPVRTPHLDELAANGVSFNRAYLMGAFTGGTCIPSRAMLLTGRNLFELQGVGRVIPPEHPTIGEVLRRDGYYPYIVGKWHQDDASLSRAFDGGATIMGRSAYLTDHFRMPLWDWNPKGKFPPGDAYLLQRDSTGEVDRRPLAKTDKRGPTGTEDNGPHTSEIFADAAADFVTGYDRENPFFLYLAFHAPHDPRQAPAAYRKMYPPAEIELTPSYLPVHPFDNGHQVLRDEELAAWPRTPEIARQELADYYAIITHLDDQIGRVVAALKAAGKYDNTVIVLAGDSGLAVGNHGLLGKQNVYDEDGIHIPLIFSGPPVGHQGETREALAYNFDILPTLCDYAGVPPPATVNGLSLRAVIDKQKNSVRDHTYHAYRQFQRAYRKGNFKLIEYVRSPDRGRDGRAYVAGSRVTQLFNVQEDPWEVYNLAFLPEYADTLARLRRQMRLRAEEIGDYRQHVEGQEFDFWDAYE